MCRLLRLLLLRLLHLLHLLLLRLLRLLRLLLLPLHLPLPPLLLLCLSVNGTCVRCNGPAADVTSCSACLGIRLAHSPPHPS